MEPVLAHVEKIWNEHHSGQWKANDDLNVTQPKNVWKKIWRSLGFRFSWKKMDVAAQDRSCALCFTWSGKAYIKHYLLCVWYWPVHLSKLLDIVTSHLGQLSLAIPSWVGAMSPSQRAVMSCGWGVKAGMVSVWVAGKTVWSHCYTRAISERFRDKWPIIKRYINSPSLLLLFLLYDDVLEIVKCFCVN